MGSVAAQPPAHVLNAIVAHLAISREATQALSAALHPADGPPDIAAGQQHYETARAALAASRQALAEWVTEQA